MTTSQNTPHLFTADDLLSLYRGRTDAVNVRYENGWRCIHTDSGEYRQTIEGHVSGRAQAAVYPLLDDAMVNFATVDIDCHGAASEELISAARVLAYRIVDRLRTEGLHSYVSLSKSGGGNQHVDLFFSEPVSAASLRRVLSAIVKTELDRLDSEGQPKPSIEIIPKQDRLEGGSIGSSIALPCFPPCAAQGTTVFIDHNQDPYKPIFERNDPTAVKRLDMLIPQTTPHASQQAGSALIDLVAVGSRHNHLTKLIGILKGKRLPRDFVLRAALDWNNRLPHPLPEREIQRTLESLFRKSDDMSTSPDQIHLTQDGLAQRFSDRFKDEVRFDHSIRQWLHWDGRIWRRDIKNEVMELARGLVRGLYAEASSTQNELYAAALARHAAQASTEAGLTAMLKLASSDRQLALDGTELDTQPDLVNFANGTFGLRTCTLRPFDPADLLTQIIDVDYAPEATCPQWERFVEEVTCQRPTLSRYLQKVFGYCLSGRTDAQAAFFGFGFGKNGKTTCLEFLLRVWGPYGTRLPVESFLMKKFDSGIPSELMRLQDKRLVLLSEIPPGKKLDVGRVKDVSGGDTLTARPLYGTWVTFRPISKLFFQGNHRPHVPDSTQALWRRLKLIPFDYTVPEDKRIEQGALFARFWNEREGIVRWLIEGWCAYLEEGLKDVPEVAVASLAYRHEEDSVGEFVDTRLEACPGAELDSRELHKSYGQWAIENERPSLGARLFHLAMAEHGYQFEKRSSRIRVYSGLRLKQDSSSAPSSLSTSIP